MKYYLIGIKGNGMTSLSLLLKQNGYEVEEIINKVKNELFGTEDAIFVPESLQYLKNGGRISPAVAALGNMIGLKPVLVLKDGALDKDSMTRNVKKTLGENIERYSKDKDISEYDYVIVSFNGNVDLVNHIIKDVNKHFPDYKVHVMPVAINVCAHCGPGTVGIFVSPKINDKSINYYFDL